jgi:hypothetical protein
MSNQEVTYKYVQGTIMTNQSNIDLWDHVTNELAGLEYMFQNTVVLHENNVWANDELNLAFCSDGGVADNVAGYGLVGSVDTNIILTKKYRLPEIFSKCTLHRSKACGLLSAIMHAQVIIKYQQMKCISNQK